MKKTLVCLTVVMAFAVCVTSCKKDENSNMQFKATMENCTNDNAKTTLNGTNLEWTSGDQVAIYGSQQNGTYTAEPVSGAPTTATLTVSGQAAQGTPYCAIYPASAAVSATSFTLPAVQETEDGSLTNFPMYAKSYDENLEFKNLCGVLKIHLQQEDALVSRIEVIAGTEINGTFSIDNSGEVPAIEYVSGGTNTIVLTCSTPQDITNGKDFYVIMPAGSYSGLTVKIQNAGYGVVKNAPESATVVIDRSKYSTLGFSALNMPIPPDDVNIWGLYSVSPTQQVWIASGNLQFKKSTTETFTGADEVSHYGEWRMAEHQYDFCGYVQNSNNTICQGNVADGNNYQSGSMWVDIYGWGTSGYTNYLPVPRVSNRSSSYDPDSDPLYADVVDITNTNYDWGVYVYGDGWRTWTEAEWKYLANNTANNKRSSRTAGATVCGTKGAVLLPDLWNGPAVNIASAYTSNTYDETAWEEMESFGAIFLPVTGSTDGANYVANSDNANAGWYWTSGDGTVRYNTTSTGSSALPKRIVSTATVGASGLNIGNRQHTGWAAVRLIKNYVPSAE